MRQYLREYTGTFNCRKTLLLLWLNPYTESLNCFLWLPITQISLNFKESLYRVALISFAWLTYQNDTLVHVLMDHPILIMDGCLWYNLWTTVYKVDLVQELCDRTYTVLAYNCVRLILSVMVLWSRPIKRLYLQFVCFSFYCLFF